MKKLLGRTRRRSEDNTELNLMEIGWEGVDCVQVAQDKGWCQVLENTAMTVRVP
jgi:hypothetical protein